MLGVLGWLGFWIIVATLMPFVLRRLGLWRGELNFLARCHHTLALTGLGVLTLHGLLALTGGQGWGHGRGIHVGGALLSGLLAWLVLLAVCLLALAVARQRPFPRTHCWLVGLLVLLVLFHVL